MILHSLARAARAVFVVAALLAAVGFVSTPPAMAKTTAASPADPAKPENMEKRIADLHQALQITAAQEPVWGELAKVMRENADKMKVMLDKWSAQYEKMNAIENLKAHLEMADENARAMRDLIPAFEKLYGSMTDDQKKLADDVFAYRNQKGKKTK